MWLEDEKVFAFSENSCFTYFHYHEVLNPPYHTIKDFRLTAWGRIG